MSIVYRITMDRFTESGGWDAVEPWVDCVTRDSGHCEEQNPTLCHCLLDAQLFFAWQ